MDDNVQNRNNLTADESGLLINMIMEFMKNAQHLQTPQQTNDNMVEHIRVYGQKMFDTGFAQAMGTTMKEQ